MSDKIFPDDKVRMILNYAFSEGDNPDNEKLQILLYDAKMKYPSLFEEFNFRTSGTYPYSELLERIVMRMRISKIRFGEESRKYVKEQIQPKFSDDEINIFRSLARYRIRE
jgi:hypothetical protein